MFRIAIVCAVLLFAAVSAAAAESPAERGRYLVNTIMACGNCHTPRDADGRPIADKELLGGLTFTTPAFGFYAGLKDGDLAAIIAYLRTVPPLQ